MRYITRKEPKVLIEHCSNQRMKQSRRNEHIVISFITNCSYMWLIDNKNEMDRTMLTNSLIHDVIVGKKGLYYSMVTKQLGIQIDVEVNILRCGSIPVTDLFPPSLTSSQRFVIIGVELGGGRSPC